MPKRTATQKHIDNINSYIDKVGQYFGTESPEYNQILATIHNAGLSTYQSSKGTVKIKNTKANRKKHQKIRSIDKNKPSFARQKKRYEKEKEKIRKRIPDGVIPFDEWYDEWRKTWHEKEQYEVSKLAENLHVPFEYETWYVDYLYREQIVKDLYYAWAEQIINELNENAALNPDVGNIDESTGENIAFGNMNDGTETEF